MIATTTLLLLINGVRTVPLKYDPRIETIAMTRCMEMKEWSHKGNPKEKIWNLKFRHAGENLANGFTDALSTFQALQKSPTHKVNNEYRKYQRVGIASCNNELGNTTVILFGGI